MKKLLAAIFISFSIFGSATITYAQDETAPTEVQAPEPSGGTELYNPIRAFQDPSKSITNPREILGRVVQILIGVSGSVALIMFLYGGILFLTSGGKADLAQKGLHVIVWSILGILLIAAAYVATNTVFRALLTGSAVGGG